VAAPVTHPSVDAIARGRRGAAQLIRASSAVTYAALVCGMAAALSGIVIQPNGISLAGGFMALAVIADSFDGRFARRFPHTPFQAAFGVQLDSLADAINSGFVPVLVLAAATAPKAAPATLVWWLVAVGFTVCAVTRLGYYNLTHAQGFWFEGLPTPVATLILSTSLLWRPGLFVSGLLLGACAIAMVAPFRLPRPGLRGLLLFALWALVLVVLHLRAFLANS
jgi:CDP-diacylglycerol---serine O-phosphatidyltransferase